MLKAFQLPIVENEEDPFNIHKEIEKANTLLENRCTGNLEISLFWEEKIVIIIRVLQLYSTFFLYYYENWPSKTRLLLTPMFSGILLSFHVLTQEMFYAF